MHDKIGNDVLVRDGRRGTLVGARQGDTSGLTGIAALGVPYTLEIVVGGCRHFVHEDDATICDGPECWGCAVCDPA